MTVSILAWLIAGPLLLLFAYLSVELLLGMTAHDRQDAMADEVPSFAILVPAHDEASGIGATVAALRATSPRAHVLVVADNCTDDTAALAAAAGAEVIERHDQARRGKGFALAYGRDHLAAAPPAAVLVIDADCRVQSGSAERIARRAAGSGRPVQAANLLSAPSGASPLVAISNFAMLVKNLIRARGLTRIGGGGLLFGTGMAFPWPLFATLPLATTDVVEDLALGLWLARQGIVVDLDDGARVTSPAASPSASRDQRRRWEHGFLSIAREQALPLLCLGAKRRSRHLLALAAHLLVPPLAMLFLIAAVGLALLAILCSISGNWMALALTGGVVGMAVILLLIAWWREARDILPAAALLRAPLYMLWKLPIYFGFFTRRQTSWNRTQREDDPS